MCVCVCVFSGQSSKVRGSSHLLQDVHTVGLLNLLDGQTGDIIFLLQLHTNNVVFSLWFCGFKDKYGYLTNLD